MKERPILFNSEMVRAILYGRKIQTRRPIKSRKRNKPTVDPILSAVSVSYCPDNSGGNLKEILARDCPQGQPGDRLWVRETFRYEGYGSRTKGDNKWHPYMTVQYKSDEEELKIECTEKTVLKYYTKCSDDILGDPWRPSIHLPRWASRINLEITDVRVEKIQDISSEDILNEGMKKSCYALWKVTWDAIYKKQGFGWDENPWVWVVCFKRIV